MRRVFAVAALLLAASCGGGPMSPTASTPIPALASGAYVLSVTIGGGVSIGGFTASVCQSSPGVTFSDPPPTNVELQHTGNTVTIQPDDSTATFRMDLQMSGATLSGTASGQFVSAGTLVIVGGTSGEPAAAAVGTASGSGAGGNLTGSVGAGVTVGAGGIVMTPALSCNGGNWSVTPR